jgi:hypothetical protein
MKQPKKKGPEPYHLDEKVREKIIFVLRNGGHWTTAAQFTGLSPSTLRDWRRHAKDSPGSDVAKFIRECKQAIASCEHQAAAVVFTSSIAAAKRGNPKPLQDFLVIRHPKRWGRRRIELTGKDGGPIEHRPLADVADSDLDAIEAILAKKKPE